MAWTLLAIGSFLTGSSGADTAPAAPTFSVSVYSIFDGLPSHNAPVIFQTRDGYMWIGSDGLTRFDGVHFTTYRVANTPELSTNLIRNLFQDKDGWLWIATQKGLCRYRDDRFERVGLEGTAITTVLEDAEGRHWIGAADKGLWEYREGRLISHAADPGAPSDQHLTFLYLGPTGRLWIGRSQGLLYYEKGKFHVYELDPGITGELTHMVETPSGIFCSFDKTLYRLGADGERRFGAEDGLSGEKIAAIFVDLENRLWVLASSPHLFDPNTQRFTKIPVASAEHCQSMIEDREGSYWIGTSGDGIARLRSSGFRMLSSEDGLLGGNIRTVAHDREGTVWAGSSTTGAVRIAVDGKTTFVPTGKGTEGEVWSVCPTSEGRLWMSVRGSLRAWKDDHVELFPQITSRVRALFEDRAGALWIGSDSEGVTRYQDGKFTSFVDAIKARQSANGPKVQPIAMTFAQSSDGTFYIGLRESGGLVRIKDDAINVYDPADGLPTADIRAIYPDREGNLWIGTRGGGLSVLSGGHWFNPEELSKPFNYQVSVIVEDSQGRVWLGTPRGIVWAPKNQLLAIARGENVAGTFRFASTGDGVRPGVVGNGFFPNSFKAADGKIWFATRHGLVTVDPREVSFNKVVPPVQIERVLVNNKVSYRGNEVRLPAGSRALAIDYTALSFVRPEQVLFRYKLEGSDADWIEAGSRRTAYYADLHPGTYRFRVVGCNDDGVWNEKGASMAVVQMPFFYQTSWFYGLIGIVLSGTGVGLYSWRTAALHSRNKQLEQRIAERTSELAKSYEAIRASEYFYHSLVESLPQIIVRKDREGRFTYANSAFAELIGRDLSDIIGKPESELYSTQEAASLREGDLRVMETRQTFEYESIVEKAGKARRYLHVKKVPLFDQEGRPLGVQILFWDMTIFREIEEKLKRAQHELVETSRRAGIAEVATGILHNLGNALNSVNTTADLATSRIRNSKVSVLSKVVHLLAEQNGRLAEFFTGDPRGKQLPLYIRDLSEHLIAERDEIVRELEALRDSVSHIKELVASQQNYARVSGVREVVPASELVEYALRISELSLNRHGITVAREFMPAPSVKVERQKALQIISNMVNNAKDALAESGRPDKRISLGVRASPEGRAQIYVTDNGVGILGENLTRIFAFGFTTKKTGHGFGLHSSALAAKELGGSLVALSEGVGQGATFVLELPPGVDEIHSK